MLRLHQLAEARKQYLLNGSNENVRDDIKHLMLTSSILRSVAVDVEVVYPTSGVDRRSRFVSRDVNAALNILACFVNPQRPEFLRRRPPRHCGPSEFGPGLSTHDSTAIQPVAAAPGPNGMPAAKLKP
eukprot:752073-Hanusia_phi.AAC.12